MYMIWRSPTGNSVTSAMCWLYFLCLGILVGLVALVISRRIHYYA